MDIADELARYGGHTAVVERRGLFTYTEIAALVEAFRVAVPSSRRVLIMVKTRNNVESLVGYLGVLAGGNVVMPVAHGLESVLAARLTLAYRPEYIWSEVADDNALANAVFTMGRYALIPTGLDVEDESLHPDLRAILLTSGSTGSPKGVRLSRTNLRSNATAIAGYLGLDASDRPITTLPMSYSYGLSVINSHLTVGATLLLTDESVIQKSFWDFFRDNGATSFSGVPYTYEMLDAIRFEKLDLPSLRYFTQAGGKLAPELVARYAKEADRRAARFYVMYGQTEATARMSYLRTDQFPGKYDSVGEAIDGGRLFVRDSDGRDVTDTGGVGGLFYAGRNVMLGYSSGRDDLASGDQLGGVLDTGDLAYFDRDRHVHIVGRRGRFIKLSGMRIDLDEVQDHLARRGIECACAGKDEHLMVAVPDASLIRPVKLALRRTYRIDPLQVHVTEVDAIKRTPSGKVAHEQTFGTR